MKIFAWISEKISQINTLVSTTPPVENCMVAAVIETSDKLGHR